MFKFILFTLFISLNIYAQERDWKVKKEIINDVPVYLINTGSGNQYFVSTAVNYGSMNDEPTRQAGLAHFFEHFIHDGNQVFPNAAAVKAEETRLGASTNAFTSADRTFYFLQIPKEKIEGAMKLQGAMMSGPAWLESEFAPEMKTVMDEALKYQNGELYYQLNSGMHLNLLPDGHPFKTYNIGTQEQLAAMNMDDVKDLYYREYTPANTNIIIAGNFSDENEALVENVKTWAAEHYHLPQSAKHPGDEKFTKASIRYRPVPNYYNGKSHRLALEMKTSTNNRLFQLNMQLSPKMAGADYNVMEVLTDYLSLKLPGSFNYTVVNELEWATSVGFDLSIIGQQPVIKLTAQLTPEGALNKYKLVTFFYNTLNRIKTDGINKEVLEMIIRRNINSYAKIFTEDVETSASTFSDFIKRQDEVIMSLDFEKAFGKISSNDVQNVIRFFNPEQTLVGYIGPEVVATKPGLVFKEPANLVSIETEQEKWQQAFNQGINFLDDKYYQPILRKIPYISRESVLGVKGQPQIRQEANTRLIYRQSDLSTDSAIRIKLTNRRLKIEEYVAKTIFAHAFQRAIAPEISYVSADTVHMGMNTDVLNTFFELEGNSLAIQDLTHWLINRFEDFTLTDKQLEQIITRIKAMAASEKRGMTASQAVKAYQYNQFKDRYMTTHFLPYLENMTAAKINAVVKESIYSNVDVNVMAWGDFSDMEMTGLNQFVMHTYTSGLEEVQRNELKNLLVEFGKNETYYYPLAENASPADYGFTRIFAAPSHANKQDFIASIVLSGLLADQLYEENRQIKGLGYVQGASFGSGTRHEPGRFLLYGQTETLENLASLKDGIDVVLKVYQDKTLKIDVFESQRFSVLSTFEQQVTTAGEELNRMTNMYMQTGEIGYRDELVKALKELKIEDIYALADKYLLQPKTEGKYIDFIATRSENIPKDAKLFDCNKFLKPE
ncbi:MAG: insulinase family protein [Bacteriovoracaceae bacterium]|nr:insulinase family protein [Bacteriovoracaceae bacterium]